MWSVLSSFLFSVGVGGGKFFLQRNCSLLLPKNPEALRSTICQLVSNPLFIYSFWLKKIYAELRLMQRIIDVHLCMIY